MGTGGFCIRIASIITLHTPQFEIISYKKISDKRSAKFVAFILSAPILGYCTSVVTLKCITSERLHNHDDTVPNNGMGVYLVGSIWNKFPASVHVVCTVRLSQHEDNTAAPP